MSGKEVYSMSPIIYGHLYRLASGDYVRINSTYDVEGFNYEYDYFDGDTRELLDGGVFADFDSINSEGILETALGIYGSEETEYEFIDENVEYEDLADMGFSGF